MTLSSECKNGINDNFKLNVLGNENIVRRGTDADYSSLDITNDFVDRLINQKHNLNTLDNVVNRKEKKKKTREL